MKSIILTIFSSLMLSSISHGQSGLIAHWDMNGSTNDVSGHGHNGHGVDIVPDTGMDGVYGHGYRFNGSTSLIGVPYDPSINVNQFSIAAIVKIKGFYYGNCSGNVILTRGKIGLGVDGNYGLLHSGYPYSSDCRSRDTTHNCFVVEAFNTYNHPTSDVPYAAEPYLIEDKWYKVIGTYNDTTYKVYIDGILISTNTAPYPGHSVGTSTDSISIGFDAFQAAAGYPYQFNGIIDDIELFNRVMSDSEIHSYGEDSLCGVITTDPVAVHLTQGGSTIYTIATSISHPLFQWQADPGTGFVNLINIAPYSGVTTDTLHISSVSGAMENYNFRCIVTSSTTSCTDTSNSAILTTAVSSVLSSDEFRVFPNPTKNVVSIDMPSNIQIDNVVISDLAGKLLKSQTLKNNTNFINVEDLPTGNYILKIEIENQVINKLFSKQ